MKHNLWLILLTFLLLLVQIIIDNYLNISIYLNIAILPFIILMLPYKTKTAWTMIIAFILGLIADLAGNGIIGMCSAALTLAALCRRWTLNISVNKDILNNEEYPTPDTLRLPNFILYSACFYTIYLLCYILLDNAGFSNFGLIALRFIISLVINVLLATLLFITTKKRKQ